MTLRRRKERRKILNLSDIGSGHPGISSAYGAALAEAATVCLEDQGHAAEALLQIDGDFETALALVWPPLENAERARRTWNDSEYATEHGAYGIAVLVVPELTGHSILERSVKGTGFDFWLGSPDGGGILFQNKARMEVSGIRQGQNRDIQARTRRKERQTDRTAGTLPAIVAVVEFSHPKSRVVKR